VRRRAYISAIPVLVSWVIIFLHDVIPHNHQANKAPECKSVYHCCHGSSGGAHQIPERAESHSAFINDSQAVPAGSHNHFICHFSSGPYHPLDNDLPFYTAISHLCLNHVFAVPLSGSHNEAPFSERLRYRHQCLRAPPLLKA